MMHPNQLVKTFFEMTGDKGWTKGDQGFNCPPVEIQDKWEVMGSEPGSGGSFWQKSGKNCDRIRRNFNIVTKNNQRDPDKKQRKTIPLSTSS